MEQRELPRTPYTRSSQIHVTHEENLPPFEGSPAWRTFAQLAEVVGERQPEGVTPTWIQERLDTVQALATAPLRGEDQGANERVGQALAHIRSAVNGRNRSPLAFTEPVEGIVKDLLDFHLTGTQASNILAVLFAYYAFKFPSFIDQTAGVKPVQEQIDYLINLASTINRDRHRYDLGSYAQLSYLGMLWADTALLMAKQLAKQSPTENLSRWFERRALYADEFMVHELMPSLTHPITLVPFGFTEYQRACAVGIIDPKGLYVGAGEIGYEPIAPEEVWPRMQVYSASCDRLGTGYGAYEDSISPALEEHLSGFLLTMRLGQSRG